MINKIKDLSNIFNLDIFKRIRFLRYIVSGGTATMVNVLAIYVFTDLFKIWYLLSAIMAFIVAFFISFSLQKYWTFANRSHDLIRGQMFVYLTITLVNLSLNTLGVFIFVHYFVLHYLMAQIMVSAVIAIESYFVYRYIFKVNKS